MAKTYLVEEKKKAALRRGADGDPSTVRHRSRASGPKQARRVLWIE